MNNSINWTGNRVLDPNTGRQVPQSSAQMMQGQMPQQPASPMTPRQMPQAAPTTPIPQGAITQQGPPPSTEKGYIPNFLASNIGKYVRAEFIIGTSQYADKTGIIVEVGINYFVLNDVNSQTNVMCDLYSVKFVTIPEVQSQTMIPLV
jgi:hypothetical protein